VPWSETASPPSVGKSANPRRIPARTSSADRTRRRAAASAPATLPIPMANAIDRTPSRMNASTWSQPSGAVTITLIDCETGS
jgi:hypothetical protein